MKNGVGRICLLFEGLVASESSIKPCQSTGLLFSAGTHAASATQIIPDDPTLEDRRMRRSRGATIFSRVMRKSTIARGSSQGDLMNREEATGMPEAGARYALLRRESAAVSLHTHLICLK